MASYELSAFDRFHAVSVVGAIEQQAPHTLNVGFGFVIQINSLSGPKKSRLIRVRILWEETCFEIFVGVHDEDYYREINLSPSQAWQSYQFEEYRYPESMPPLLLTISN